MIQRTTFSPIGPETVRLLEPDFSERLQIPALFHIHECHQERARRFTQSQPTIGLSPDFAVATGASLSQTESDFDPQQNSLRTTWQQDPYAQGSYSFDKIGQQPKDRRVLAQSVGERLFFAGEATHPHFHSSVHGAYETGIRAAREILG